MNTKQIVIAVAGSDGKREFTDVRILPGTKARDVLGKLGLDGFQLARPDGGSFGHNEDLFDAIADGQKVYATKADVEAGRWSLRNALEHMQLWLGNQDSAQIKTIAPPGTLSRLVTIGPNPAVIVAPPPRSVWDERGWGVRRDPAGRVYEGRYRVKCGRSGTAQRREFSGWILEPPPPGVIAAYVANPPAELRKHPKGACFQLAQPPWFRVHWTRPAQTVDDAVLYIERVLAEALGG